MNRIRKRQRTPAPRYLELPGPVWVIHDGEAVRVVNAVTGDCVIEFGPSESLQGNHGSADSESINPVIHNHQRSE